MREAEQEVAKMPGEPMGWASSVCLAGEQDKMLLGMNVTRSLMMNTETTRANGFIRIDLYFDYLSALDNEQVTDEVQSFWVQPLAPDRFKIQESSGFLHEYKLFFGDEIVVEPMDTSRYKLQSVIDPSPMRHFFFIGSGQPTGLTQGLHELGGQWECEMGGLTIFHVPRHQLDAFQARFGMDLNAGQEMFSGVQDWSDEIDALS